MELDRLIEISKRLDVLMPEVTALQSEANELRAIPHPDEALKAKVAALEMDALLAAGHAWEAVREFRHKRCSLHRIRILARTLSPICSWVFATSNPIPRPITDGSETRLTRPFRERKRPSLEFWRAWTAYLT
jgi:hypothetical protein